MLRILRVRHIGSLKRNVRKKMQNSCELRAEF